MTDKPTDEELKYRQTWDADYDADFLACMPCHVKRKKQKHQVFVQDGVYHVRCLNCERINLVLDNTEQIRAAEAAARAEGRREGLEEAAKELEERTVALRRTGGQSCDDMADCYEDAAAAIRAKGYTAGLDDAREEMGSRRR